MELGLFNKNLVQRRCPVCNSSGSESILEVDPKYFVYANPTLNIEELNSSGLLELPHIPLVRCNKCSTIYGKYLLGKKWERIFWESVFMPDKSREKILKHSKRARLLTLWYELYKNILSRTPNSTEEVTVLDFGCGWGDLLRIAQSEGVKCVGVEIDDRKLEYCRQHGLEVYKFLREIPKKYKFKILFSDQVFEHLPRPRDFMGEIKKRLDKDFIGFVSVPNYNDEKISQTIVKANAGTLSDKNLITWDHLNFFSPLTLHSFLIAEGLEVIDKNGNVIGLGDMLNTDCYFRFK